MPTYSYECPKCNKIKDIFHSMKEDPIIKCDNCKVKCNRLFGKGNLIFLGDGWESTGYAKSTTPLKPTEDSATVRVPHYADKNTGKPLGFGDPEIQI